ncbi:amino acid transporter ANT1-like [Cannabis sativa]|uniref:amino acid transporter ANT1-like n=1 Tax=Cannabis sativa TaxID=3483 RepID=UPI0029CA1A4B|nr:amino acid transporter ANT1-like [Cannabis sativa]
MEGSKTTSIPLLQEESSRCSEGTASRVQTIANIVVSIVGTGVLGLPFAFLTAGWLAGSVATVFAGISVYYCMFLLVKCSNKLSLKEEEGEDDDDDGDDLTNIKTYGDLGYECMGTTGRLMVETLIGISQCGGCVVNLVFIGQNLSSVFRAHNLSFSTYILLLVPIEIGLSWIRSLSSLAHFSIFANVCNVLAMGIVVKEDIQQVLKSEFLFDDRTAITSKFGGLAFAVGMAVFCFEGFGMTLALEASMKDKRSFPKVLAQAFFGIALLYVLFGFFGYMAYGDQTKDIITLNLPRNWWALTVQIGMCLGLIFTFPITVHPLNEIIERRLKKNKWCYNSNKENDSDHGHSTTRIGVLGIYSSRGILVIGLAVLASYVPEFGVFTSLVGSTVCALIAFVFPAIFHLKLLASSLNLWQKALDLFILSCGLLFAVYGTYNTVISV